MNYCSGSKEKSECSFVNDKGSYKKCSHAVGPPGHHKMSEVSCTHLGAIEEMQNNSKRLRNER